MISSTAPGAGFDSGVTVQITGVSCSSPSQCLMVDNNGDAPTATDPLGGTAAWTVQNLIPFSTEPLIHNALFSASCPSSSFCAIGGTGEVLTSVNPGAPRPKRPRVLLLPKQG